MFIQITDNTEIRYFVNTDRIDWFAPEARTLKIGDDKIILSQISTDKLDSLFNEDDEELPSDTQHRPSEAGDLLNKLHKLVGGRGDAKLTTDRKARLTTRLKDFSQDDLILAATNLGNDEFMQGANDSGKRYGTIDYLIRTSANVNKFLEEAPKKQKKMF